MSFSQNMVVITVAVELALIETVTFSSCANKPKLDPVASAQKSLCVGISVASSP